MVLVESRAFPDDRGFFVESYRRSAFVEGGVYEARITRLMAFGAFARIGAMTGSNAESSLEAFGNAMRDRRWIEHVGTDAEVAGVLDRLANGPRTVVDVFETAFTVSLIPFTLENTTAGGWSAGTNVNLEVDLVSRYVVRALDLREARP